MTNQHILVLGAGSAGKRHLQNFAALGCQVSAMDPREDRLAEAAKETPLLWQFPDLASAMGQAASMTGVVVASPTKFHAEQAETAMKAGLPVLLEKPVSRDAASSERLMIVSKDTKKQVLLGYTYRWSPAMRDLKKWLGPKGIGKVLHVQCNLSMHLADWHPRERYQDFFMSSKDLGGGALLGDNHFLDLMIWFFGMPSKVFARMEKASDLQIETDDTVDALFTYANGLRVTLHLDLYGRPHDRSITVRGDRGTVQWTHDPNRVRFSAAAKQEWQDTAFPDDGNKMFTGVAQEFLQMLETGSAPSCSLADGHAVMRLIEAMRESQASGWVVTLK